ncbi:MAG: hypothetical protein JWM33_3678 [Caulobacteraceae bacterium]|nr:hypothetical protein [Caulobacteraceae bacterium]
MKKFPALFLQIVIVLIGIGAAALLLLEPRTEGVNAHATTFEIYSDPFILLVYAGSVPFFVGLYQTVRLLRHLGQGQAFSPLAVRNLKLIKYCAMAIIAFVVVEEIVIMLNHGEDDAAGGVFMGVIITFGSVVVAAVATVFERTLQSAVDIKSENDLTV